MNLIRINDLLGIKKKPTVFNLNAFILITIPPKKLLEFSLIRRAMIFPLCSKHDFYLQNKKFI